MTTRPKVSILIPVYNTARYLPECMKSVQNQTLKEIEIVAVNDASPDNAAEVLAEYAAKDPRVKVVTHEKNGGILAARLSGIKAATGEFIICLDADDTLTPDIARAAYEKAVRTGADMVHFQFDVRMENGKKTRFAKSTERNINPAKKPLFGDEVFEGAFVHGKYRWNIVGKMIAHDVFRKAAEALPPGYYIMAEDFCFCTLMSFYSKHYEPLRKKGYNYILNTGVSAYKAADRKGFERLCTVFTALNAVRSFLKNNGIFEKYEDAFCKQEDRLLGDLLDRWIHRVIPADRPYCFAFMLKNYDPCTIIKAMKMTFSDPGEMEEAARGIGTVEQFNSLITNRISGKVKKIAIAAPYVQTSASAQQLAALAEQNPAAILCEDTSSALTSDADTVILFDTGSTDLIWDILSLKLTGKRLIVVPGTGLLCGNTDTLGHLAGRAIAYRFADAVGCFSAKEAALHRSRGMRSAVLPILKRVPVRKNEDAKNIVWLGNGGNAAGLLLAAGAFAKLRDSKICTGDLVIVTPGIPEESERKLKEWSVAWGIRDHIRICDSIRSGLEQELTQAAVLLTGGETEIAAESHFFDYGPVICADPAEITPDGLNEKLKECFDSKFCPPVPEFPRGNWEDLFAMLTEDAPAPQPGNEALESLIAVMADDSRNYEHYSIVPPRDGDTFYSFYAFFDKKLAKLFPPGTRRRHILFAGTRYIMRKIFRKG